MIKPLNNTDRVTAGRIHTIFQSSYRIEADLIGVRTFPPLERSIEAFQESKTTFCGYYTDGNLAGVIETDRQSELLEICSLVVDPRYFRRGIARQLLEFVLRANAGIAAVETAKANKPAIALYQKLGFVEEKVWMTSFEIEKIRLVFKS